MKSKIYKIVSSYTLPRGEKKVFARRVVCLILDQNIESTKLRNSLVRELYPEMTDFSQSYIDRSYELIQANPLYTEIYYKALHSM